MDYIYTFPKWKVTKNEISCMEIFFENGDYVTIKGSEIVSVSNFEFYDKLVFKEKGFEPVAGKGEIKLKICNKSRYATDEYCCVYNHKEIFKNRKKYIENRCIKESKIIEITFRDSCNWAKNILGQISAKLVEDYLVLEFVPDELMGEFLSEKHHICLPEIKIKDIRWIDLDFENCENFTVYNGEILEFDIKFFSELCWGSGELNRKIESGYMIIKLEKVYNSRKSDLFDEKMKFDSKTFERRLCGKKGFDIHDICHLYVDFCNGRNNATEECFIVDDIKPEKEVDELLDEEERTGVCSYYFEGGYCKKLKDGSIAISFGKDSKKIASFK